MILKRENSLAIEQNRIEVFSFRHCEDVIIRGNPSFSVIPLKNGIHPFGREKV
jgi:hypothetical protein